MKEIVNVLRKVGEALKYIHESRDHEGNEFTHGDVAARNVLLTHKNLDTWVFNLSRVVD